ncbi:MAG TPA: DNA gyrase inhibitor YacG [Steroidobacteraceae bacterium]|nr:DNA gyrase inhibitor YacG [Steroidobacteraceae bacterium]
MAPAIRPCPTCGREIEWSDRFPARPFCSDRCRLIDLGAWLSEDHAIHGDPVAADDGSLPPREPPES